MKKGLKWLVPLSFAGALVLTPHMANASEQDKAWHATPAEDMDVDTSNPHYQIKWGDTLFNLGIHTGSSVEELFNMNQDKISDVNNIQAHDVITIPTSHHSKDYRQLKSEKLTYKNVDHMKKDVRYMTSDGQYYILNGKYYNQKGKPLADMTIDEIKKLPLQNGIYDAEEVK